MHASPPSARAEWRDWAGFFAVSSYEVSHEREYNAIRNAAALIDISPLFKYRLSGKDAVRLVDRVADARRDQDRASARWSTRAGATATAR